MIKKSVMIYNWLEFRLLISLHLFLSQTQCNEIYLALDQVTNQSLIASTSKSRKVILKRTWLEAG